MKALIIAVCLVLLLAGSVCAQPLQQPTTPYDKDIQLLQERIGRLQAEFELTRRDLIDLVKKQQDFLMEQAKKRAETPPTPGEKK